jgi:hypothetical protein
MGLLGKSTVWLAGSVFMLGWIFVELWQLQHPGCDIKGNINQTREHIYHLPGQKYYSQTTIRLLDGERWFCSEAEAIAGGWRKSRI